MRTESTIVLERRVYHLEGDIWLVPCLANYSDNCFTPLSTPINEEEAFVKLPKKHGWSRMEDKTLLSLVQLRGPSSWKQVSTELNSLFYKNQLTREPRDCRERWYNHVDPNLKKGNWTIEEDLFILQKQQLLGNRWSDIARQLVGRTENSVKNRWNSMVKNTRANDRNEAVKVLIEEKSKNVDTNDFTKLFPII